MILKTLPLSYQLVYVTARLAVVFGINSASNEGGKIVIVRGTCYKLFLL